MERDRAQRTNLFIDADLWRALRMRALEEGDSATDLINRLIAEYLKKRIPRSVKKKRA